MPELCEAITKARKPCPIEALDFSIYCHVHEPILQCGARKKDGTRCGMVTAGVRCKSHRNKVLYLDYEELDTL